MKACIPASRLCVDSSGHTLPRTPPPRHRHRRLLQPVEGSSASSSSSSGVSPPPSPSSLPVSRPHPDSGGSEPDRHRHHRHPLHPHRHRPYFEGAESIFGLGLPQSRPFKGVPGSKPKNVAENMPRADENPGRPAENRLKIPDPPTFGLE